MSIVERLTNPFGLCTYRTSSAQEKRARERYRDTVAGSDFPYNQTEVDAFIYVRELLLDQEIRRGKLSPGDQNQIDDFSICITSQTARYTNPKTKNQEEIDLPGVDDKDTQDAIAWLYKLTNAQYFQHGIKIAANCKGNLIGPRALQRTTAALKKLPLKFSDRIFDKVLPKAIEKRGPVAQNIITRRFLFAEKYTKEMTAKLKGHLEEKQKEYVQAKSDTEKKAIREDIRLLNELIDQFKHLDWYALSKVLTLLPIGPIWEKDLEDIADRAAEGIGNDIKARKGWFDSKELTEDEKKYQHHVVLELIKIKGRGASFRYSDKRGFHHPREGILSTIVDAAERSSRTSGEDYTGEEFKNSILLDGLSSDLKGKLIKDFNQCGVVATHAIPHQSYPNGEDRSSKGLTKAIQEHRKNVKKDVDLSKLVPSEPSGESRFIPKIAWTAVGLLLAKYYGAVSHLYYNPGLLKAGVDVADLTSRAIVPYKYDEHGFKHRSPNWKRIALTAGVLGLSTLFMSQYSDSLGWPDETSWTLGSIALWMMNQRFRMMIFDQAKEAVSSTFPQIGHATSRIERWVDSKTPERMRAVVPMAGMVVKGEITRRIFNQVLGYAPIPSYETVADTTQNFVPLLQPVAVLGNWLWDRIPSFLPNIGYGAFI